MVILKHGFINEPLMIEEKKYKFGSIKLYNLKYIIYNLMHLYHNYKILNNSTQIKIQEGKNIRDELRIKYILKQYLKEKYNDTILDKFKNSYKKFKKYMFKIKDLNIIDELCSN